MVGFRVTLEPMSQSERPHSRQMWDGGKPQLMLWVINVLCGGEKSSGVDILWLCSGWIARKPRVENHLVVGLARVAVRQLGQNNIHLS